MSIVIDIHKKFKGFKLDVAFETKGKCTGILGASGCGKSMSLKCIAGIEKPDKGMISVNDEVLYNHKERINLPAQKRKVGYLFQNYALFPNMTVEENIAVGIKDTKENKAQKVMEQVERFQLDGLEKRYPSQLSGGQQQRVALARIFAYEPDVILLDEPFSALDSFLKDTLQQQLLKTLEAFKGDIIMVSHSRDELYTFCDQLIVMDKGEILLKGDTKEIFEAPKKVGVARLTGCKNISPIKRLSSHEVLATDWNITLQTTEEVGSHMTHIGIRAHDIRMADKEETENVADVEWVSCLEFPFEKDYLLRNVLDKKSESIYWKVDKEIEVNQCVKIALPKEALLLLES